MNYNVETKTWERNPREVEFFNERVNAQSLLNIREQIEFLETEINHLVSQVCNLFNRDELAIAATAIANDDIETAAMQSHKLFNLSQNNRYVPSVPSASASFFAAWHTIDAMVSILMAKKAMSSETGLAGKYDQLLPIDYLEKAQNQLSDARCSASRI